MAHGQSALDFDKGGGGGGYYGGFASTDFNGGGAGGSGFIASSTNIRNTLNKTIDDLHTGNGKVKISYSGPNPEAEAAATPQTENKVWKYKVPVKYTYYTVPNMRVFTINRLEIYNKKGTSNTIGLPFLYKSGTEDNTDYTLYPTDSYKQKVKTTITNLWDSEITSASILNRANYESAIKEGRDTWSQTEDMGLINSTYSDLTYSKAKQKAEESLRAAATLVVNGESNVTVANATDSKVSFKLQNTAISIGSGTDKIQIVDGKRISKKIELQNFDENGFNFNNYGILDSLSYKKVLYNGKYYLDYATTYPNVDSTTNKISSHYYPSFSKTNMDEWANNIFNIPTLRLNGDRLIKAKIYYTIDERNTINTNVPNLLPNEFRDTEWKDVSSTDNISTETLVDGPKTGTFLDRATIYQGEGVGDGQVQMANVFTPIGVKGRIEQTTAINPYIDHTLQYNPGNNVVIQKNARFKVVCLPNVNSYYGGLTDTKISQYIKSYYVKLDFDVENVKIADKTLYKLGQIVPAGTWIGPVSKVENYITAQAVKNPDTENKAAVFLAETNKIWVMAIANNVPTSPANLAADIASGTLIQNNFADNLQNNFMISNGFNSTDTAIKNKYYGRIDITNISNYAAISSDIVTTNLGRIFDFKVTDVKDVEWKNVFRKTEGDNLNVHTGNLYYSGTKKWDFYSLNLNEILARPSSDIGTSPKRILPVGPYKNTNTGYTKAPKMGYRFSFDIKTTGRIPDSTETLRKVDILPSFYYVSKNASNFLMADSFNSSNKKIKLFYKNSSGKYVEVGTGQDTYKISFVPKDGYRYVDENLYGYNNTSMLNTTKTIGSLKKLELNKDMMATSNGGFVQTWYGEYKLPNSTIAVEVTKNISTGKETYDINKPLKDGYIGVVFDIEATMKEDSSIKLNYDANNRSITDNTNTSQWDYEGFMGFASPGADVHQGDIKVKLEKGTWSLTNDIYNKIKGTVILYDTDSRAANDFE